MSQRGRHHKESGLFQLFGKAIISRKSGKTLRSVLSGLMKGVVKRVRDHTHFSEDVEKSKHPLTVPNSRTRQIFFIIWTLHLTEIQYKKNIFFNE